MESETREEASKVTVRDIASYQTCSTMFIVWFTKVKYLRQQFMRQQFMRQQFMRQQFMRQVFYLQIPFEITNHISYTITVVFSLVPRLPLFLLFGLWSV